VSLPLPMAERRRGSTAAGHLRLGDGTERGARALWKQGERDAHAKKGKGGAEGRSPWSGVLR
jgi:hypothetical protein